MNRLQQLIDKLKSHGEYQLITDFFEEKRNEVIMDAISSAPLENDKLIETNAKIGIYETLMNLDKWVELDSKKEREGGRDKLKKLGNLMRFWKR